MRNRKAALVDVVKYQLSKEGTLDIRIEDLLDRLHIDLPDFMPTEKREKDVQRLDRKRQSLFEDHVRKNKFWEGALALRCIRPFVANPQEPSGLRLLARLSHDIAWFLVHLGRCRSALMEALQAIELSQLLWSTSYDRWDLYQLAEAAQIASNACLIAQEPKEARHFLELVRSAREASGWKLGSEYFLQQARFFFQQGPRYSSDAENNFNVSANAMERLSETTDPIQPLIPRIRGNIASQKVDWEWVFECQQEVAEVYPPGTLEFAVTLNYAVAAGLIVDSAEANQVALDSLHKFEPEIRVFGHETTIRKLLAMTPHLELTQSIRADWVRRALLENAFTYQ